jgi:hypothetical protein
MAQELHRRAVVLVHKLSTCFPGCSAHCKPGSYPAVYGVFKKYPGFFVQSAITDHFKLHNILKNRNSYFLNP